MQLNANVTLLVEVALFHLAKNSERRHFVLLKTLLLSSEIAKLFYF